MRDYQLVTPSLDGILHHESAVYEGVHRPEEVLRIMDGPSSKGRKKSGLEESEVIAEQDYKVIEQYFHDIYGIFMKKLSHFIVSATPDPDDTVKLQALLQEMIKIKKLVGLRK